MLPGMSYPSSPQVVMGSRTLMIALAPLEQSGLSGRLPNVPPGAAVWVATSQAAGLAAASLAAYAPSGTPLPPWEPAHCVHGIPGFAAATTNSSPGR
jgi:hypothetical protein